MPSNWLYVDTNFPSFTGEESTEEKVSSIQNYLYMLVEQLRYSMHNLDQSNMNQTAARQFSQTLTQPILARIEDGEGALARLSVAAGEISAAVSDLQSGLGQTLRLAADGVTVTNAAGSRLTIDGGQIRADTLDLTGCISFSDLSSGVQGSINGAANAASAASALANAIVNGQASGTFISGTDIYSPTIHADTFRVVGSKSAGGFQIDGMWEGRMYTVFKAAYYVGSDIPDVRISNPAAGAIVIENALLEGSAQICTDRYRSTAFSGQGEVTFGDEGRVVFRGTVDFSNAKVIGL